MLNYKINIYLNIIFFTSFLSIISALFIEYLLGHQPCNLCLIQRVPYGLSIILIFLNLFLKKKEQFIILLLIIIFSFSLLLSFYHFGIEQGFFQESLMCDVKNSDSILSKEELLLELQKKQVSCKDVTFKIFGLSLTSINILISLILLSFLIKIFIFYEKIR